MFATRVQVLEDGLKTSAACRGKRIDARGEGSLFSGHEHRSVRKPQ
jgi:hypothetical protein